MLRSLEEAGNAVAYKEFDGTLAWKASDEMHKHFRKYGCFWLERIVRKTTLQQQQIVLAVDRDTGTIDLSVFVIPSKGYRTQTVGTATLRMADVPEVIRLLNERLRFEDQLLAAESAARKSKRLKARKPWVHSV